MPRHYGSRRYRNKGDVKWHNHAECPDGQLIAEEDRVYEGGKSEDKCDWCRQRSIYAHGDDPGYIGGGR